MKNFVYIEAKNGKKVGFMQIIASLYGINNVDLEYEELKMLGFLMHYNQSV